MERRSVSIITTGGSIDKIYPPDRGSYDFVFPDKPAAQRIIRRARITETIIEVLPPKDSLDFTDEDRQRVVRACHEALGEGVVITHGTDTMKDTASTIHVAGTHGKYIVLTGAGNPESMKESDADFIGVAYAAAEFLPPQVSISP